MLRDHTRITRPAERRPDRLPIGCRRTGSDYGDYASSIVPCAIGTVWMGRKPELNPTGADQVGHGPAGWNYLSAPTLPSGLPPLERNFEAVQRFHIYSALGFRHICEA
jgi:hypothetical protein